MAYAGIQTMLLAYKMQKCDKEFELMQISNDLTRATKQMGEVSESFEEVKSGLDKDDPDYEAQIDALDDEYNNQLAEIAAWEDELQQKESNCNTQISLLSGYIESWQSALQTNVAKAHTYGAQ